MYNNTEVKLIANRTFLQKYPERITVSFFGTLTFSETIRRVTMNGTLLRSTLLYYKRMATIS